MKLKIETIGKFERMSVYDLIVENNSGWLVKSYWINRIRILER